MVAGPVSLRVIRSKYSHRLRRDSLEPRSHRGVLSVTDSNPAGRYQDIRRNVAKLREYLARAGGLDQVLTEQSMTYDAIRMCFIEISEWT
jgi:hypothetical protein